MLKEALAALSFKVEIEGQVHGLDLKPGDLVRYERQFGEGLFDGLEKGEDGEVVGLKFDLDRLFYLTYSPARRAGVIPADMDYDAYLDVVDDVIIEALEVPKDGGGPAGSPL